DLLASLERQAAGPISAAQACAVASGVEERLQAIAEFAEPAVVALARELQPQQLQHLRRKYERNNRKFHREWLDDGPRGEQERRFEQVLERFERVYGRLGSPQRAVLRQALAHSVFDARRVLAERQRRQQD